jgi:hypothetical protein
VGFVLLQAVITVTAMVRNRISIISVVINNQLMSAASSCLITRSVAFTYNYLFPATRPFSIAVFMGDIVAVKALTPLNPELFILTELGL